MPDICWSGYLRTHQEWQLMLEQGRFLFGVGGFHPTWATCFYLSRMGMVREAGYFWGREGSFRGTNIFHILQEVRRQNIRIWGTGALPRDCLMGKPDTVVQAAAY